MIASINRLAFALASLTVISAAGLNSVGAAQFAAANATRGGASINCSVPNNVVCTITSQKGVKSVKITANTPQGTINLVNSNYNCPKSVQVGWDSAYQAASTKVVECGPKAIKAN